MIDICPLSLFHHQQGGNTIKSPVLPISSAYGLLKHPSHCTTGERKFVPCEVAALRPLLMLPFLELSSFPRSQSKTFSRQSKDQNPQEKGRKSFHLQTVTKLQKVCVNTNGRRAYSWRREIKQQQQCRRGCSVLWLISHWENIIFRQ